MKKLEVQLGGVPEHFNLPWHLANEEKLFEDERLKVHWHDYGGGTGAMIQDLNEHRLDIALLLTEGALAGIAKGGKYCLAGYWVTSPLSWGIHTHNEVPIRQLSELQHKTIAISRPGSGSHLMAYLLAKREGWPLESLTFEVVGNLEGARDALANGKADFFLWEKYTTKPLVDSGEWVKVGEIPTPWPCFVIAVRKTLVQQHKTELGCLFSIARKRAQAFAQQADAADMVAERYGLQTTDAESWFRDVRWAADDRMPVKELREVLATLHELQLLEKPLGVDECVSQLCTLS